MLVIGGGIRGLATALDAAARGLSVALVDAGDFAAQTSFNHQRTAHDQALVDECRRVVKPGGTAVFQVYNRISWLHGLSKVMKVALEHEDAPVLKRYSAAEFRRLLGGFRDVRIVEERFPVKSRLHGGWKGLAFNTFFVGTFNALPRAWVRRFGWHLLAFCTK